MHPCDENNEGNNCYNEQTQEVSGSAASSFYFYDHLLQGNNFTNCKCTCYAGYTGAACKLFTGLGNTCYSNVDCIATEECFFATGKCRTQTCMSDANCGAGQTCTKQAPMNNPATAYSPPTGAPGERRLVDDDMYYPSTGDTANPAASKGICQSAADLGPPINCVGAWQPQICRAEPPSPYSHLNCQQEFKVVNSSSNGGECLNEGGVRTCLSGPCSIAGCDGQPGSMTTYDLCGVCGGGCTTADKTSCSCSLAKGCNGIPGAAVYYDICGECGGDTSSCTGANQVTVEEVGEFNCLACPAGKVNNETGRSNCEVCPSGTKSGAGETSCTECVPGQYRGTTEVGSRCRGCLPGQYTIQHGQPFCLGCALGRYAPLSGTSICKSCDSSKFSNRPSQPACKNCVRPYEEVPNDGHTACEKGNWKTVEDCREDEYLDTEGMVRANFTCKKCPVGSWCDDNMNWTHTWSVGNVSKITGIQASVWNKGAVKPQFGWARCLNNESLFQLCPWGLACLGAPNPLMVGRFEHQEGKRDPALMNSNEECGPGYANGSQVCGRCDVGYSHTGLQGECAKCPSIERNRAIMIFGFFGAIIGTFVYIRVTLAGAAGNQKHQATIDHTKRDDQSIAAGVKSIGLTYMQMMTLLATYPIAWPTIFTQIFQVGGAVAAIGKHVVNLKCLFPDNTEAGVFYAMGISWVR